MYELLGEYDEILYLDMDVVSITRKNFFTEFDLNKGIVIKKSNANYNLHIKPADVKVREARAAWGWKMHSNRSPNAKFWNAKAIIMEEGGDVSNNPVFNTGIIGVNKKGNNVHGCSKIVKIDKIDSVLPEADILYLALPETPETKNLINNKRLNLLKSSCGIVNIGRQSALDYDSLCEKLTKNELAGAILDVFEPEPIEPNSKLWDTPNLVITPHVSSDDGESYVRLTLELFVKNLKLFIENKPLINQIDKKLGY